MAKGSSARRSPLTGLVSGFVAVLMLLGAVVLLPGQMAQAASAKPSKAKIFEPGKPNRTAVGKPIPKEAGKDAKTLGSEVPEGAKELADKRTEYSRTFSTREGLLFTQFSEQPVN
jgi:hypothetical protein